MKKELRKILDNLGVTPMDEPELNDILGEKDFSEVVEEIWKCKCADLDPSAFPDEDLELFFKEMEEKVFFFNDKDGSPKITSTTENIKPINYFKKQEYITLIKKLAVPKNQKDSKFLEKTGKRISELLIEGIEVESLCKWEVELIKHIRSNLALKPFETKQGKTSKS